MGNRNSTHVIPDKDLVGWDVKKYGAQKASKHFNTKSEAAKRVGYK